jgi:hypothetical protein
MIKIYIRHWLLLEHKTIERFTSYGCRPLQRDGKASNRDEIETSAT